MPLPLFLLLLTLQVTALVSLAAVAGLAARLLRQEALARAVQEGLGQADRLVAAALDQAAREALARADQAGMGDQAREVMAKAVDRAMARDMAMATTATGVPNSHI